MPSTRKQKAREKRSRQSDVMSDLENVDIMLGNYSRNELDSQLGERETELDLESNGPQTANPISEDFRSLINTNSRKNSEITIETARLINNEITSQVTRKLDEIRSDLNYHILEVINSAITEKVLPSIQNVLGVHNPESDTIRDSQSGRLNRSPEDRFGHMDLQSQRLNVGLRERSKSVDHWSNRLSNKGRRDQPCHMSHQSRGLERDHRVCSGQTDHQSNIPNSNSREQYGQADYRSPGPDKGSNCYSNVLAHRSNRQDTNSGGQLGPQDQQNSMKTDKKFSNHIGLNREISTNSQTSDQDCDMVTGAKHTPHTVPEFLTGRPMQSQEPLQNPEDTHGEPLDPTQQVPGDATPNTTTDPINRLADILVGINNRPTAQTLTVRPVSSTTVTFDEKSEKFELFEDLFHTMIKMQPEMTEAMKINHFHSLLRKNALQTFRNINSTNKQTLEDILAIFRRKYVKPESQATAKHKWHRLVFDPNTMKLPDFLEELNQGAGKAFGENAQAMIHSLLYAKLPPKLKRSVNMARLENATYEEIVAHLERELELNGLEEGDDIPVPTITTAPTATLPGTGLLSSGIDPNITCNYCKKPGHVKDDCRKLKRKEEQRRNDGQDTKKEYPKCPTCDKTNHPAERCWKGAGAHLKPKNLKLEDTTVADMSTSQEDVNNKQTTSILKNPKN